MPRGDGTGPLGMGPMTGRAAGYCAGWGVPGYINPVPGRGFGRGFGIGRGWWCWGGQGRGWRNRFYATGIPGWMWYGGFASPGPFYGTAQPPTKEQRAEALRRHAEFLRKQLEEVEKEISGMKDETET